MDRNLALEVVRVTEAAALAAARFMGRGDEVAADMAAAEAIERAFRAIPVAAHIVIGEGQADDGVSLYEGEKLGSGTGPEIYVAVDAVEGNTRAPRAAPTRCRSSRSPTSRAAVFSPVRSRHTWTRSRQERREEASSISTVRRPTT
jgi:hypothetical protein